VRTSFFIEAIRLDETSPVVVDRIIVRSEDISSVTRQARLLAETAVAPEWNWPAAEALRVVDDTGAERFRCRCRVVPSAAQY
jgi:hypothetical protein